MKIVFWQPLLFVSVVLGVVLSGGERAIALEASMLEGVEVDAAVEAAAKPIQLAQVTSVSELSDVQPGDWAYTALQRLVEEYGCLEGYPDRTFRGNRALTRYEFAAGLNACLDVVIQLRSMPNFDETGRLQEEFAAELAVVRSDVDRLQTDVAEIEANQFSTTTKLRGILDAHLVVPFSDTTLVPDLTVSEDPTSAPNATDGVVGGPEADATFEYWARLQFDTSFTGKDRLLLSVSATDAAGLLGNTESGLNYTTERVGGVQDNVGIDDAFYSFPVGDRITAKIAANSVLPEDFVSSVVVPFSTNAVAAAGLPEFYFLWTGGAFGAGTNVEFSDSLILDLAYLSATGNENEEGSGLFNNYSYLAQLNLLTDGIFNAAVVYLDGDQTVSVGDGINDDILSSQINPEYTVAGMLSLDFDRVILAGHYAYSPADGADGDLDSYMGGVSFPGLLSKTDELGIYGGISPAFNRNPLLVEAYYKFDANEFLSFTPAIIYADNDSDVGDDSNFYGAMRATFRF